VFPSLLRHSLKRGNGYELSCLRRFPVSQLKLLSARASFRGGRGKQGRRGEEVEADDCASGAEVGNSAQNNWQEDREPCQVRRIAMIHIAFHPTKERDIKREEIRMAIRSPSVRRKHHWRG